MNHSVWSFRPLQNGKDLMSSMLAQESLILTWPDLGDLESFTSDAIKEKLDDMFPDYTPTKIGRMRATLKTFVQKMQEDDHVLIPYKNQIYIARITGAYQYQGGEEPQIRKISFINTIPAKACAHRFAPTILAPMYLDSDSLDALIHWERDEAGTSRRGRRSAAQAQAETMRADASEGLMDVSYPLRRDLSVTLRIPTDISQQEAERLSDFVRTLFFTE